MKSVSKCQKQLQLQTTISRPQLLSLLLKRTYTQHSLEYCFPPSKIVDNLLHDKKSKLSMRLREIQLDNQQEIMEVYFNDGLKQVSELTEYYKYYTQTSILHQQSFFQIMHQHREQQKVYHYHKFKALLNLSNSTQHLSTFEAERDGGIFAPSFLLLQQLSLSSNNEESLLIVRLKDKLLSEFGPNRYHSLQEIDKQYIFAKKIHVILSPAKKNHKMNPNEVKETTQRNYSLKKRLHKKRNNICDLELYSSCKPQAQSKLKRKKNASMTSLCSVDKSILMTRQSSLKCTRTLFKPTENIQNQVKTKIMGVKEKIRQQKEQLLKKSEMAKPKKQGEKVARRQRH